MKKILFLLLVMSSCGRGPDPGWKLAWSDEFNLNLTIGGQWPGNPDETTQFPDTVFMDYVRVYQK